MKVNINIRNAFGCLCIPLLALGVLFASCTDELSSEVAPGGGGKGGESEVTLKLQVPGKVAGAGTRAVTDDEENEIDDLYILAFKVDKDNNEETFDYYVTARNHTQDAAAGESTWTATLKVKDYQQRFVMIANAQGTPGKVNEQIAALAAGSVGHVKADVLAKLTDALTAAEQTAGFNATATTDHHPFTMCGQTETRLITGQGDRNLGVTMRRVVARVQVQFTGQSVDENVFTAESVSLYNYNDRARVTSDNLDNPQDTDPPTIPQGARLLPTKVDGKETVPTYAVTAEQDGTKAVENAIYLFETAQPAAGTDLEKHVKRPCLIVKGSYKKSATEAKTCYYRVDLATADAVGTMTYMDVKRNHSYNVTISNVTGEGHDTPQEALESKPANITATVVAWDQTELGGIDFDGKHELGIGTMKYQLNKRGGTDLLQQVKASTGLEWTVSLYEADAHGEATATVPGWIRFAGGQTTLTGTGTNQLEDYRFTVDLNDGADERRAVMQFTARNLQVNALVVQDLRNPPYIIVKDAAGNVITEDEFLQAGSTGKELRIEFGPEGTELTYTYIPRGMTLNTITWDGAQTTDLTGTATSDAALSKTVTWQGTAAQLANADQHDYLTQTGILQLSAAKGSELDVANIRLFQKKYGVQLETTTVPCTGSLRDVRVKGNMPWVADMNADGFQTAVDGGWLKNTPFSGTGSETDEFVSDSRLSFDTQLADYSAGKTPVTITFKHRDRSDVLPVEKQLSLQGCLIHNNKYYEVSEPVQRSINTRNNPLTDASNNPLPGWSLASYSLATAINATEPDTRCMMNSDAEFISADLLETGLEQDYGTWKIIPRQQNNYYRISLKPANTTNAAETKYRIGVGVAARYFDNKAWVVLDEHHYGYFFFMENALNLITEFIITWGHDGHLTQIEYKYNWPGTSGGYTFTVTASYPNLWIDEVTGAGVSDVLPQQVGNPQRQNYIGRKTRTNGHAWATALSGFGYRIMSGSYAFPLSSYLAKEYPTYYVKEIN